MNHGINCERNYNFINFFIYDKLSLNWLSHEGSVWKKKYKYMNIGVKMAVEVNVFVLLNLKI